MPLSKEIQKQALMLSNDYKKQSLSSDERTALNNRYKILVTAIVTHVDNNKGDSQEGVNTLFIVLQAADLGKKGYDQTLTDMGILWGSDGSTMSLVGQGLMQKIHDLQSTTTPLPITRSNPSLLNTRRRQNTKSHDNTLLSTLPVFPMAHSLDSIKHHKYEVPPNTPENNIKTQSNPPTVLIQILNELKSDHVSNRTNFGNAGSEERKDAALQLANYIIDLQDPSRDIPSTLEMEQAIRSDKNFSSHANDIISFWKNDLPIAMKQCAAYRKIIDENKQILDDTTWRDVFTLPLPNPTEPKEYEEYFATYITKYSQACLKVMKLFRQNDSDANFVQTRNALLRKLTEKIPVTGLTESFQDALNSLDLESKRRVLLNPHWQYILCKSATPKESFEIPNFQPTEIEKLAVDLIAEFADDWNKISVVTKQLNTLKTNYVTSLETTLNNLNNSAGASELSTKISVTSPKFTTTTRQFFGFSSKEKELPLFIRDNNTKKPVDLFPSIVWIETKRENNIASGVAKRCENAIEAKFFVEKYKIKSNSTLEIDNVFSVNISEKQLLAITVRTDEGRVYTQDNISSKLTSKGDTQDTIENKKIIYGQTRNSILQECLKITTEFPLTKRISAMQFWFDELLKRKNETRLTLDFQNSMLRLIYKQCDIIEIKKATLTSEELTALTNFINSLVLKSSIEKWPSDSPDAIEKKSGYIQGIMKVMLCDFSILFARAEEILLASKTIRNSLIEKNCDTNALDDANRAIFARHLESQLPSFSKIIELLQNYPQGFDEGYKILLEQTQSSTDLREKFSFNWQTIEKFFDDKSSLSLTQKINLLKILWKGQDIGQPCKDFFTKIIPIITGNLLQFQSMESVKNIIFSIKTITPTDFALPDFKNKLQALSAIADLSSLINPQNAVATFWKALNEITLTIAQRKQLIEVVFLYPNLLNGAAYQQFMDTSSPLIANDLFNQDNQGNNTLNMGLLAWINKHYVPILNNNNKLAGVFFSTLIMKAGNERARQNSAEKARKNSHENISNELRCITDLFQNCSDIPAQFIGMMFVYVSISSTNITIADVTKNNLSEILKKYLKKLSFSESIKLLEDYPLGLEEGCKVWYQYFEETIEPLFQQDNSSLLSNAASQNAYNLTDIFNASLTLFELFIKNVTTINIDNSTLETLLKKITWIAEHSPTKNNDIALFWEKISTLQQKLLNENSAASSVVPASSEKARALHDFLLKAIIQHPILLLQPSISECMTFFTAKDIATLVDEYDKSLDPKNALANFLNTWLNHASEFAKKYKSQDNTCSEFLNADDFIMPGILQQQLYKKIHGSTSMFVPDAKLNNTIWVSSLSNCIQVQERDALFQQRDIFEKRASNIKKLTAEYHFYETLVLINTADGWTIPAARHHKVTALQLKQENYEAWELAYSTNEDKLLSYSHYTPRELLDAGYSKDDVKTAGYSRDELINAGYSEAELNNLTVRTENGTVVQSIISNRLKSATKREKDTTTQLKILQDEQNRFTEKMEIVVNSPITDLISLQRTLFFRLNEGDSVAINELEKLLDQENNILEQLYNLHSKIVLAPSEESKRYINNILNMLLLTDPIACLYSVIDKNDDVWTYCTQLLQIADLSISLIIHDTALLKKAVTHIYKEDRNNTEGTKSYNAHEDLAKNWLNQVVVSDHNQKTITLNFDANPTAKTSLQTCSSYATTFETPVETPKSLLGTLWAGIKTIGNFIVTALKTAWNYSFGAIGRGLYKLVSTNDNGKSHDGDTASITSDSSNNEPPNTHDQTTTTTINQLLNPPPTTEKAVTEQNLNAQQPKHTMHTVGLFNGGTMYKSDLNQQIVSFKKSKDKDKDKDKSSWFWPSNKNNSPSSYSDTTNPSNKK